MKRFSFAVIITALVSVNMLFAANPESDFNYKLSNDAESIIITGFKNNRKAYDIPNIIEDIPVKEVQAEFLGFAGVSEIAIKVPEGITQFALTQIYSRGTPQSHITIMALPSSLENCRIFAQKNRKQPSNPYVTLKGSLKSLSKLTGFKTEYVDFEEKFVTVKKEWNEYSFQNSTVKEVIFEEGVKNIDGFGWCTNLTKVTLPSTAQKISDDAFSFCSSLAEIVIPDSLTRLDYGYNSQNFDGTQIPLKTQVRLKKLGYNGSFGQGKANAL